MKRFFTRKVTIVVLASLVLLVLITAFNLDAIKSHLTYSDYRSSKKDYRVFVFKKGIAHFSFEYPDRWRISRALVDLTTIYPSNYVELGGPYVRQGSILTYTAVSVLVYDGSARSATAIEEFDKAIEAGAHLPGVDSLERSSVTVDGAKGYQAIYLMGKIIGPVPAAPPTAYRTEIFFEHNGLIWHIMAALEQSTLEQDKIDFEHLTETFKILD